ncbi:hypothetical protein FNV43_RR06231 [Rhamnella rubrinervis]|uniref:Bromodomain associated domain-containing protein n=1 Tax=Rhamnella rubrinervis TaxID=2594499 RepID=A0A8K0HCN4_9ROSA|nr:hypothetical protein FNV43_RR06231 [Rhamnella rubrinervis]
MKPKSKSKSEKKTSTIAAPTTASSTPSEFSFSIARIAVSQICQSVGFRATQLSALETLTHVATKYLQAIASSASFAAASSNRTQCNLFDIIESLHDLHSIHGFAGASTLHKTNYCLLGSSILVGLADFVEHTTETPFTRPIPRLENSAEELAEKQLDQSISIGMVRGPHVPRWLPEFPDRSRCDVGLVDKRRKGEELWENCLEERKIGGNVSEIGNGGAVTKMELAQKRGKVRFRIGVGVEEEEKKFREEGRVGLGVNSKSGVCKGGKRVCLDREKCGNGFKNCKILLQSADDDVDNGDENLPPI